MKDFWSRHPWLRMGACGALALLTVLLSGLLYVAYVYMPPEDRTDTPAYLRWMQIQHLDGYVEAGNFRLHYLHEGHGKPVILLPGNGGWIYSFREMIPSLASQYSVYVIDTPGDGYTTPLASSPDYRTLYTLNSIDQSLLAFMDHFHLKRAAMGGNSEGGGIALSFAETHPDRVSKYISLDGTGLNIPDTFFWQLTAFPVIGEVYTKLTISRDAVRQILSVVTVRTKVTDEMVEENYIPYTFHPNVVSWWVMERTIHWQGTEQLLPQMKTPALVIWGKQDTVLDPHLYLPRWHTLDPSAKVVELNQAGHAVQVDQPEQVKQLLLNFLAL